MGQVSHSSTHPEAFRKCEQMRPQFEQPEAKLGLAEKVVVQTEIGDSESFVFIVAVLRLLMNAMRSRGGRKPDKLA